MKKNLIARVCFLLCLTPAAYSQNQDRALQSFAERGDRLEIKTNDGQYRIRFYSENIVETSFIPNGESEQGGSHAVVMQPAKLRTTFKAAPDSLEYASAGLVVRIAKAPFQISYAYKGRPLLSEKLGYHRGANAGMLDFNLDGSENLYGAGARALGMNRRGYRLPLYNKAHYGYEEHSEQMNFAMPLVFSSKMYGIHFDNPAVGTLDLDSKKDNTLAYETVTGRKTYQVIAADSWAGINAAYTGLTGRQPLLPRWALGNFASRFGYHSEGEARDILAKFKEEQVPVDAIIFDLYWFGKSIKGTMGNFEFDRDNFPDPKHMIADFAKQGVKTVLITEPFILTSSKRWDEAVREKILAQDPSGKPATYDFYFGNTGLIDVFDPVGQNWFWNQYKTLKGFGVAGWWGDLGEPEVHPDSVRHHGGSAAEVHNIYGHQWARLIADGYRKEFPTERPFILMRAGYSGSQRTGMIPWSGDVNRSWGGLRSQPEIALQMGMQGMAYMHSDLGGFANANLDDELYVRWLQYGVFQPVFRPHAQEEVPSEPVLRAANAKALAKAAIELRYRLLPYNYTLAFENSQTGMPLMRPLFYEEPHNPRLFAAADSYLWGNEFLVHPVVQAGVQQAEVYFPATAKWFDFYSGAAHQPGSTATVALEPGHIPVFVRAGAFVPMSKPLQNTSAYTTAAFDLHYYHDDSVTHGQGRLYDDNGALAQAWEQGAYSILNFDSRLDHHRLRIAMQAQDGKQQAALDRTVDLTVHNVGKRPARVLWNGKPAAFAWDEARQSVQCRLGWTKQTRGQLQLDLE